MLTNTKTKYLQGEKLHVQPLILQLTGLGSSQQQLLWAWLWQIGFQVFL
jgi:hypothetical protein